jgi:MYXO-CTERM domain-containing protein
MLVMLGAASAAFAATQITVQTPFALSDGASGDKPKIQRLGDGTLVVAYGDSPVGAGTVYDIKAAEERTARDVFIKTCKPDATRTCNTLADWSPAINVSQSAFQRSTGVFDWRGTLGAPSAYSGDIDKPNIKTSGPMMVLTWVGKYCPGGAQRAILYPERDSRVIPFSCAWSSYSTNKGASWSAPIQLSTGVRDAIQDASSGNVVTDSASPSYNRGQIAISWQEDPQGLQLGEAEGPGDGGSGALVNGGTDIWYAYASVDLRVPGTPADDFVLQPALRLTDNWSGQYGIHSTVNYIYDGAGANVAEGSIEKGEAGASRANIGMVGTTTIVAYEETKESSGLDSGKFVRYHAFPFNAPPAAAAGCIISDAAKNARRVRFLTQGPNDAGADGLHIAIFWRESIYNHGGPSDIVLRRGMGGVQPTNMVPAVDPGCATSDYPAASALTSARGENISSNSPTATTAHLADDTERNAAENALAHRGVLRGPDLWIGYSYTSDLSRLQAQLDNYNFWIRKFTVDGAWGNPQNVTNIADRNINVREPRLFATPKSTAACAADPAFCQDTAVMYLAWGTQTNVPPGGPAAQDLGEFITVSRDSAATFAKPVKLSMVQGVYWGDEESAYESQNATRPDGTRFYSVWNQKTLATGATKAEYTSGDIAQVADPVAPVTGKSGGCSVATGNAPLDPMLPMLALLGLLGLGARRLRRE